MEKTFKKFMDITELLNQRITDLNSNLYKLENRLHKIETIVYKAVGVSAVVSSIVTFLVSTFLK